MGAGLVDTQAYETVISQLKSYTQKMIQECTNMTTAARTCNDNMDDDSAKSKAAKLQQQVNAINNELKEIEKVIAAMQKELDASNTLMRKHQSS